MKKLLTLLFLVLTTTTFAQSPQGINYQAVIRDNGGSVLANQTVGMKVAIIQTSPLGTVVYEELFTSTTSQFGLVNVVIGDGTAVSGDFTTIDWSAGPYFVEVSADETGGTNYAVLGTQQLMSVPYALHANSAENVLNDQVDDADNDPTNELQDWSTLPGIPAGLVDGIDDVNDADSDPTNELQTWSTLPGIPVDLADGIDNVDDADNDPTNELQDWTTLPGIPAGLADGVDDVDDADNDPTNELQALSLSNDTLYLSNSNSVYLGNLSGGGSGGSAPVGTISYPMANHMFYTPTTGNDGELIVSGNQTMDGIYNFTKFHLEWTGTINIGPKAFLLIKADTVIIDGIIDGVGLNTGAGSGGGSGGGGGNSIIACANCSGTNGFASSNGYYDQILGGAGGPGGVSSYIAGYPGLDVDTSDLLTFIDLNTTLMGARGGRWCGNTDPGGNGGAGVIIVADYYTSSFTSTINVNGANGVNTSAGGGGGGSIVVKSNNFGPIDGNYSTLGGNGRAWSNCWAAGGNGGDGLVLFITP